MKKPTTIRLPEATREAIEELAKRSQRDFSSLANEMLEESLRMRRIPGVVFADGPTGRRARLAGTGLEIFEIIAGYVAVQHDWGALRESYPWLSELQLRAALAYAHAYPEELRQRLKYESDWSEESLRTQFPFTGPPCASI